MRESLEHEKAAIVSYYEILKLTEGKSVLLEEFAHEMIVGEELHLDEVNNEQDVAQVRRCPTVSIVTSNANGRHPVLCFGKRTRLLY